VAFDAPIVVGAGVGVAVVLQPSKLVGRLLATAALGEWLTLGAALLAGLLALDSFPVLVEPQAAKVTSASAPTMMWAMWRPKGMGQVCR